MARRFQLMAVGVTAVLAMAMPAVAAQTKTARTRTMTISGTLQKVDGQNLTIQTASGPQTVMLATNVQVRRSGKSMSTADLAAESGSRVTVRYMDDNGHKMAQSVTLAAAPKAGAKGGTVAKK